MLILSMHNMKLKARKIRKTKSKIKLPTRIPPLNEEGGYHGKNPKLPPTIFFNILLVLKVGKYASKRDFYKDGTLQS